MKEEKYKERCCALCGKLVEKWEGKNVVKKSWASICMDFFQEWS